LPTCRQAAISAERPCSSPTSSLVRRTWTTSSIWEAGRPIRCNTGTSGPGSCRQMLQGPPDPARRTHTRDRDPGTAPGPDGHRGCRPRGFVTHWLMVSTCASRVQVPSAPPEKTRKHQILRDDSNAVVEVAAHSVEDPIASALDGAAVAWSRTRDPRGLRRALHELLAKLEDLCAPGQRIGRLRPRSRK